MIKYIIHAHKTQSVKRKKITNEQAACDAIVATPGEWQCGVRRPAVANWPNIIQMLLVLFYFISTRMHGRLSSNLLLHVFDFLLQLGDNAVRRKSFLQQENRLIVLQSCVRHFLRIHLLPLFLHTENTPSSDEMSEKITDNKSAV